MQLNKSWFDEKGRYVPLEDRDNRTVFDRVFSSIPYVVEFTNIASSYLHVYVTEDRAKDLANKVTEKTDFSARVKDIHGHSRRYISGNWVVVLEVSL